MTEDRRVTVLFEEPDGETLPSLGEIVAAVANAGLEVGTLGIRDDLDSMVAGLHGKRPDLVLNLVRRFAGNPRLAPDVAAALDLLELPYTGASAPGLYLHADPVMSRKLLIAHDIPCVTGPPDIVVAAVGNERPIVIAEDEKQRERLGTLISRIFATLRLRDYALLGFRLSPTALVSAEPNPALGRNDPFAKVCAASGLLYEPLIAWILDEAWDRGLTSQPAAKTA